MYVFNERNINEVKIESKLPQNLKKAVALHAMKVLGGTGGIAPTHSQH
jgi:hypothetical protein